MRDAPIASTDGEDHMSNLKPERQIIAWKARAVVFVRGWRYRDAARCRLRALKLQRQLDSPPGDSSSAITRTSSPPTWN